MRLRWHCKPAFFLSLFLAFVVLFYHIARRELKPNDFSVDISKFVSRDSDQVCQQPQLKLWPNEQFRRMFQTIPETPKCAEEDWIYTDNGTVRFSPNAVKKYGAFKCDIRSILRDSDFQSTLGPKKELKDGDALDTDFFHAECKSAKSNKRYENFHAAIVRKSTPKVEKSEKSLDMNILILGFDSVSHLSWQRKLPKTYQYIAKNLGSVLLKGYNIVGDGTPAALLPILTGKTEEELPNADRGHGRDAKPLDGHPFIWKKLNRLGYVTQFAEDGAGYSTFNYRMMGFDYQPTDHYMRTFYLMCEYKVLTALLTPYCLGSKLRHNVMLDWIRDLYIAYPDKPKFTFAFHNQLSHDDNNPLAIADEDVRRFLEKMNEEGHLERTLLVLMSDHGARFQRLRNTEQGNFEERNPFFSIRPPAWFKSRYPEQYAALVENGQRLTTPFDIHATLVSLLDLGAPVSRGEDTRATSLFSRVSKQRTCQDAAVSPHWCACLQRKRLDTKDGVVRRCAGQFTKFLNLALPSKYCHMLRVTKIHRAFKLETNPVFARHKIEQREELERFYLLTVTTQPGGGSFEFTAKLSMRDDIVRINGRTISRINKYGNISACVADTYPKMRPYCVCKHGQH